MSKRVLESRVSRRTLLGSAAIGIGAAVSGPLMPRIALAADEVVKIGFLAPLTGEVAAWGKPGLDGCEIWAEWVNADGGIKIGDKSHMVEFVSYDNEYDPGKARAGATKLIKEDGVKFVMMLGGDTWPGVQKIAAKEGMLFSTLLPSDLTPDTTTLLAPAEVHPIYNVTGVEWLAQNMPDLKNYVICAQDDALGLPSVATYLAAFEAEGIEPLDEPLLFDPATTDFAPVVTKLLAGLQPRHAFFGRKDAQQLAVVRRLALDLSLPVQIVPVSTVREVDGLALSSRNRFLSDSHRLQARALSQALFAAADAVEAGERDGAALESIVRHRAAEVGQVQLEYAALADAFSARPLPELNTDAFLAVAARVGETRLIDNVAFSVDGDAVVADRGVMLDGPSVLEDS